MPLRDHFHPPLSDRRHWESFHSRWASAIAERLDGGLLPEGYFAEVQVHLGNCVEVDIATFEEARDRSDASAAADQTAVATAPAAIWAPPEPQMNVPARFPDRVEVLVFNSEAGPTLVGALELVSPRNKDRPQSRTDFAGKCASYLHQGIGLVVIDVVTNRNANLHNDLMGLMGFGEEYCLADQSQYAVSYQLAQTDNAAKIRVWHAPLRIDKPLPTLPLPLDKGQCVRLDIDDTYELACQRMRLPSP